MFNIKTWYIQTYVCVYMPGFIYYQVLYIYLVNNKTQTETKPTFFLANCRTVSVDLKLYDQSRHWWLHVVRSLTHTSKHIGRQTDHSLKWENIVLYILCLNDLKQVTARAEHKRKSLLSNTSSISARHTLTNEWMTYEFVMNNFACLCVAVCIYICASRSSMSVCKNIWTLIQMKKKALTCSS